MTTYHHDGTYTGRWQGALTPTPRLDVGDEIRISRPVDLPDDVPVTVDGREWADLSSAARAGGGELVWSDMSDQDEDVWEVVAAD